MKNLKRITFRSLEEKFFAVRTEVRGRKAVIIRGDGYEETLTIRELRTLWAAFKKISLYRKIVIFTNSPDSDVITDIEKKDIIHGRPFKCKIDGEVVVGQISLDDLNWTDHFYLCQNELDGGEADDKLGYKHSWVVSHPDLKREGITDFQFLKYRGKLPVHIAEHQRKDKKLMDSVHLIGDWHYQFKKDHIVVGCKEFPLKSVLKLMEFAGIYKPEKPKKKKKKVSN